MPKSSKTCPDGSLKRRNISEPNLSTRFRCPHCPFQGCNLYSLKTHLVYHSTKSPLQCSFCTYSVSNSKPLKRHTNRVHPEESALLKKNRAEKVMTQTPVEGEAQLEIEIPAADNTVYVTIGTEDSDEEAVMVMEDDPDNPWCISCGKQSDGIQAPMVQCDQCDGWFHGSCVGADNQVDEQWFCPVCIHKEFPMRHMTKLIKAVDSFTQVYLGGQLSSGLSSSLLNSNGVHLNQSTYPSTSLPTLQNASVNTEEVSCRKELAQLALGIRSSRAKLAQAFKDFQEETRLMRASRAENLHQRMEKLKSVDQDLSVGLVDLMEAKRHNQEDEVEKKKLKMKTDEQLFNLRMSSCRRVKKEASVGSSFSLEKTEEQRIQKRERLLLQLKKKLSDIWEEERSLNKRIQATEKKLEENSKNLESLQAQYFNPAPEESSPIVARIKRLKRELRDRIERFAGLELRLLELNSKQIKEDILQKKKEWLDSYDCDD